MNELVGAKSDNFCNHCLIYKIFAKPLPRWAAAVGWAKITHAIKSTLPCHYFRVGF
jgi:hypothetical protein